MLVSLYEAKLGALFSFLAYELFVVWCAPLCLFHLLVKGKGEDAYFSITAPLLSKLTAIKPQFYDFECRQISYYWGAPGEGQRTLLYLTTSRATVKEFSCLTYFVNFMNSLAW